ncbi:hypothetical protein Salat_2594900 [Sesamum alatum]|uniref:Uncharacterized protein n=1 Tax=Sesamum alatum TaxID=300844 RepID=A0AAE1XN38_9LAMI|nr:hypothetical protein Salat_2594900 [Sesamum alatum]
MTDGFVNKHREFNFYFDAKIQESTTQIGSSNPVKVMQPADVVDNEVQDNEIGGGEGFNDSDYDLSDDGETEGDGEGDSEGDEVLESGDDVPNQGPIVEECEGEANAGIEESGSESEHSEDDLMLSGDDFHSE